MAGLTSKITVLLFLLFFYGKNKILSEISFFTLS
jgi:hypothetical protein